jgi:uncharacterized phosphosugar-binding protein
VTTVIDRYFEAVSERLRSIVEQQADAIDAAAAASADSIEGDGLVFSFGTGHGSFAALEMFPRTGTIAGFRPIAELPITLMHHVFGDMGTQQYRFLHKQEGYGNAILRAHRLDRGDTMILFSQSGLNAVILDIAIESKQRGLTVVGVTSIPHSSGVESRHSSGKRLYEAADIVIDTQVPKADAGLQLEGSEALFGPTSTPVAVVVAHGIVARTAEILLDRGYEPRVMLSPNVTDYQAANANNDKVYEDLWRRLTRR